jgi:hypothetical protein
VASTLAQFAQAHEFGTPLRLRAASDLCPFSVLSSTYSRKPTPDNFYPKITKTVETLASLLNQAT